MPRGTPETPVLSAVEVMKMFYIGSQGPIPHRPLRGQWEYFLSDYASI